MRPCVFFRKILVSLPVLVFAAALFSCRTLRTEGGASISDGLNYTEENKRPVLLNPESFAEIEAGSRTCVFKTSSAKAAIYINSEFQGYTPLEVDDLVPGFYFVTVQKDGFGTERFLIQVRDGRSDFYYVRLEPRESRPESGVNTESDTKK